MPNSDRPRGFAPYGKLLRATPYEAGSACYPGDLIMAASDGQVDPATAGAASGVLGVALSYAAAAGDEVIVADHPDQLFVVQADETEVSAQSDIFNCFDHVATAGDTTYKTSRHELDSSDTSAANAATLQLLKIERRPDNALGEFVDCVVRIYEHQLGTVGGLAGD